MPHHRRGLKFDGGDEYLNRNLFKEINVSLQEKIDIYTIENKKFKIVKFLSDDSRGYEKIH